LGLGFWSSDSLVYTHLCDFVLCSWVMELSTPDQWEDKQLRMWG
jgi:hypothetical protein